MATETSLTYSSASYLTTPAGTQDIFSPERFSDEQRMMAETAHAFITGEVLPRVEEIEAHKPGLMRALVEKAGALGLLSADVPEEYGGLGAGLTVGVILADYLSGEASFGVAWGAHNTIGTLPIVFYGTPEQKARWLPGMATGAIVGAYALTEPGAGSDAMGIKTRATRDGDSYVINGQKQWISNSGIADVMVAFAKVDETRHTAFIVPFDTPGIALGAEEKKMGIKGSSTRAVYFDNVRVPAANVLGEVGKGHKIAFNILNIGRLKLGASCAGGSREALALCARYVTERKAFGKTLQHFGLIQKKLAQMAIDTYAAESVNYRTAGLIEEALRATGPGSASGGAAPTNTLHALEEYAVECSIAKVLGSEALARVVDEGVQIFGGYGFMHEYPIEKAYRDARITRIFEGTNEINRLLLAGTLFKRAMDGRVGVMDAFADIDAAITAGQAPRVDVPADLRDAAEALERAKSGAIYTVMKAAMQHMMHMEEEQEFLAATADMMIDLFAMDSALTRAAAAQRAGHPRADLHALVARLAVWRFLPGVHYAITEVLENGIADAAERDDELRRVRAYLGDYHLASTPALRELARAVVAHAGYPFAVLGARG
jgi:alkylation response protein AidB-like acyl-CoA dehydrogenase